MFAGDLVLMSGPSMVLSILLGILIFSVPKRYAAIPLILAAFYVPLSQRVVITGLDFTIFRMLILAGWMRLIIKGEYRQLKINRLDQLILIWVIVSIITGILLEATEQAIINRLGFAYNAVGCYFYFRYVIRDLADIVHITKFSSLAIIPIAISMIYESTSSVNSFSLLGGVAEHTMIRGDRLRCQGPFAHPILAGTFGATMFPLYAGLYIQKNNRLYAVLGILSAAAITVTSSSSGPAMTLMFGVLALSMWPVRKYMNIIKWVILFMLVSAHMIMKAPVWYLIARISDVIGGTGWHRSYLIDQAISKIDEWWLVGTKYTAHWIPHGTSYNEESADITNQYIFEGVTGGLTKLILFVVVIIVSFNIVGYSLSNNATTTKKEQVMIWSLGAALFAHVTAFMSVSYFDQMIVMWYLVLAMISCIAISAKKATIQNVTR